MTIGPSFVLLVAKVISAKNFYYFEFLAHLPIAKKTLSCYKVEKYI